MAVNLRFGASTDDTNLSGGSLFLGNKKITTFTPPPGINKVVGVYSDLETRNVYFAMYNSEGAHGLYRINGETDAVDTILSYYFLNFKNNDDPVYKDYDVSMTVISGLLYWTDNVNEPRVINIEKGIRTVKNPTGFDVYINPFRPENFSQIKRPPCLPPTVYTLYGTGTPTQWYVINLRYTPKEASKDYQPDPNIYDITGFGNDNGYQFSYYYVYDNDEESCLAPWSDPVFWKTDIVVQVPGNEFANNIDQLGIVKKVVFVYRINNDGVPYIIATKDNIQANYISPTQLPNYSPLYNVNPPGLQGGYAVVDFADIPSIQTVVKDLRNIARTPVASDITSRRFDSVPLLSKTNTIAQNRLNHANYVLDRNTWGGLTLSLSVENPYEGENGSVYISSLQNSNEKVFKPGGLYEVGIELLDGAGRPIGVVNNTEINIPKPRVAATFLAGSFGQDTSVQFFAAYDDMVYNMYRVKYNISGTFPLWAKYARVVCTGVKNINYFHRGLANIFYWYQSSDGVDRIVFSSYYHPGDYGIPVTVKDVNDNNKIFTYKGIAIDKMGMPVNYSDAENMYVRIAEEYTKKVSTGTPVEMMELKVVRQTGNLLLAETSIQSIIPAQYNGGSIQSDPLNAFNQIWYNIEVYSKKNIAESIFYQSDEIKKIEGSFLAPGEVSDGYVSGDCYTVAYKKSQAPSQGSVSTYTYGIAALSVPASLMNKKYNPSSLENAVGIFTSMNPADAYSQNWVWAKGQEGIINENQKEVRIQQGIIFSGTIIQGTQTNGLNKFNSLDSRLAPAENGAITSLVTTNATQREPGVLLAIGTFGVSSFYYDAIQLTNVDGSSNVTTTDAYLASQRPLLGQYGCSRSMSITKTPLGTVYWWSDVVNDLIRYSNAGLERLGMTFSFGNFLRKKYNDNPLLITWYDQVTDEICLLGKGENTSVFSERFKTFQGQREYFYKDLPDIFYPERATGLPTKQYWFLNGSIYVTDVDQNPVTVPHNFTFESFKDPSIQLVTNEAPATVKRWNQIKVFGNRPKNTILSTEGLDPVPDNALVSTIEEAWWVKRKEDYEAAIRRAINSNGSVMSGKLMESRIIYSNFVFGAEAFDKLNFIEVKSNVSIVQ